MKRLFISLATSLALSGLVHGYAQTSDRADLVGSVTLPTESKSATVLIATAQPKPGAPITAHSPRLPLRIQTDAQGRFKFESLDSAWLYAVAVLAPGCRPQTLNHVDPTTAPLKIQIEAADTNVPPDTILRGRVLDPYRRPVSGALITIQEVTRNNTMYFSSDNIDRYAVSDDAGNFFIYGQKAFVEAGGAVQVSGLATGLFEGWKSGSETHELALIEGASVHGRLLHAQRPVADAELILDRFGAESGSWAWTSTTLTDNEGRFSFDHLPTNRTCRFRGTTGALGDLGAVPTETVSVGADNSTNDIGDLNLDPTFDVSGQIRLSDGKPVPAGSLLYFGNFGIGMSSSFPINGDGSFRLTGFPAGTLTVYLRVRGYELAPRDAMLISGSATNLTVTSNLSGLVIPMHPQTRPH